MYQPSDAALKEAVRLCNAERRTDTFESSYNPTEAENIPSIRVIAKLLEEHNLVPVDPALQIVRDYYANHPGIDANGAEAYRSGTFDRALTRLAELVRKGIEYGRNNPAD